MTVTLTCAHELRAERSTMSERRWIEEQMIPGEPITETAPGIDVQRDVLDQMDCQVVVQAPQRMPAHVFE